MIKANELRIGNTVYDKVGDFCKTITVNSKIIVQIENGAKSFKPVPLTPEILEKCGFKKVESHNQYGWYLNIDNRLLCWCHSEFISLEFKVGQMDDFNDVLFDFPCKYLHQLQNLYFALTGEELTYLQSQK